MDPQQKSMYRVSIKACIADSEGKFLLLEEPNGSYDLPGGSLDYGEETLACIAREVREEIGGDILEISPSPLCAYNTMTRLGNHAFQVVYAVKLKDFTNLKTSDECVSAGFFSVKEAKKLPIQEGVKRFIENRPLTQ